MKSETFEVDFRDFNTSRVLKKVKIVGIAHLLLTILAFFLSLVLPWAYRVMYLVYPMQLVAFLVFVPIGFIAVLLLVGAATRHPCYMVPFIIFSYIGVVLAVVWTIIAAVHMKWGVDSGFVIVGITAACAGLEAWSCVIVNIALSHLDALNTVKPALPPVLHRAKVVGIIHLVLAYIFFYLSLILPAIVKECENLTQPLCLVALFLAIVAVSTVYLLIGVSQCRASFLLPFAIVCFISYALQALLLLLGFISMVREVDSYGRFHHEWIFVALHGIFPLLELWSFSIVRRAYHHLSDLKSTADQRLIVKSYSVPQDAVKSIYPHLY